MTALNKQALTDESARESGNILLIVAARMARRELFTPLHFVSELPQKMVSMRVFREALERSEETLQCEVCKIVDGHNLMAKKIKEAESKLEAAEERIAELEARTVGVPEVRITVAESRRRNMSWRELGVYNEGADVAKEKIIAAIRAAGIGVKGE